MNINDKFITSFFRACVKLYNYDGNSDNEIEIKSLNEFITKCNEKLSIIEDNELLNSQINDLSKQINKITQKYNNVEKKYVNMYNDLRDCRIEFKSSNEENEKLKKNINDLFGFKTKYEKDILLKNQQIKQIQTKYNSNKAKWKTVLEELEEQNTNYQIQNKDLSDQNIIYINEINKIEEFKKSIRNRLSSDTIEQIDVSIIDMIEKANEYEKKYKDLSNQHQILKNNYDDLNDKYNELFSNQTNQTNELKQQIKLLLEQLEKDRKMYNDNIILIQTKKHINNDNNNDNNNNIKYFDIRDKKAIGYFEKDIKLFNEKNDNIKNDNINKEQINKYIVENISYSTDYMVDLLKASDKVKPNIKKYNGGQNNDLDTIKEIEINESDTQEILSKDDTNYKNNDIFMKKISTMDSDEKYINIENKKIINDSDEYNKNINIKKELDEFIMNNKNNNVGSPSNDRNIAMRGGGKKKNSIEIIQIDDKYKMKFDNDFNTLTEQNINFNDEKLIKKIRHRKYMRHNRDKNK